MLARSDVAGFSIGEVSKSVGVPAPTLRWWEREGLVKPQRSERGRRIYTEADVERAREIKRLRSVERLNFPAIRKQLGPTDDGLRATEPDGSAGSSTGERLRLLRVRSRKTLKEVAEATGLSLSFISAIERGDSGGSVASLGLLAGYYGAKFSEVFGANLRRDSPLVRKDQRAVMRLDNGVRYEDLAATERLMDPTILSVPPQTGSGGFYTHEGEEFAHVMSGVLFVELKDQGTFRLEPGDTLYFSSSIQHRWWAEEEAAEAILVNTPPSF
jgi:DNA-binding transcriptional MerR regulator/mannose-6-phosphate isomerase-like protein (cupin superfamily)